MNNLRHEETERLSWAVEECGEVLQRLGKVLRYGYQSFNPNDRTKETNREGLVRELGDLAAVLNIMAQAIDINTDTVGEMALKKLHRLEKWVRCSENKKIVKDILTQYEPSS